MGRKRKVPKNPEVAVQEEAKEVNPFGDSSSDGGSGAEEVLGLNKEYAKNFEKDRRDAELRRIVATHGIEEDSSEDTTEDEEAVLLSTDRDMKILEAFTSLKRGDKDGAANIITELNTDIKDHLSSILTGKQSIPKGEKKLTLRDHLRETIMTKGAEAIATLEEDEEKSYARNKPEPTEGEEDAAKKAFQSAADTEEDGFVLTKTEKSQKVKDIEGDAPERVEMPLHEKERRVNQHLEQLFHDVNPEDKKEMFLKSFFLNQGWQQEAEDVERSALVDEMNAEAEQDAFEEQQKNFEEHYEKTKYHHEEEDATEIKAHPRAHLIDTVRNDQSSRKEARERKKLRESEAQVKRDEEVKRLKFLKRKEMDEKMKQIEVVAGKNAEDIMDLADMDEDYDAEEWDKKMDTMFNEDYYDNEDDSFDPSEYDSDDLELSSLETSSSSSGEGAARHAGKAKKMTKKKPAAPKVELTDEERKELQKKKRQILKQLEEEVERDMEQYAKLDYEDVVAGQKVRFKYASVAKDTFGLTDEDILGIDDRSLNSIAPLKFYAPYRSAQENRRARVVATRARETYKHDPEKEHKTSLKYPELKAVEIHYPSDEGETEKKGGKKRKQEGAETQPSKKQKKDKKEKAGKKEEVKKPAEAGDKKEKKEKKEKKGKKRAAETDTEQSSKKQKKSP